MWSTTLICYHAHRATYRVGDSVCRVCWRCLDVRSDEDGLWVPTVRLLREDGLMTDVGGRVLHDDWYAIGRRLT